MHILHAARRLQLRKVVLYLLGTELAESRTLRALDALVAEHVVRGLSNDSYVIVSICS